MIPIAQEVGTMTEPSVQNLLTFIGFNLTIATLFFALVYSYSKNLLEKINSLQTGNRLTNPKDKLEAWKVCKYFFWIDLITFSALSLLVFSATFGTFCILEILKLTSAKNRQCFTLLLSIGYFVFTLYYLWVFKKLREYWPAAKRIFPIALIIEVLMIVLFIILNFLPNYMYLLVTIIIVLGLHIVACLVVSCIYAPMSVLLTLWDLTTLPQKDEKPPPNKKEK
jgi:hypothetical protein